MFYTYILYSKYLDVYYKGFTTDILKRLEDHVSGKSKYTSKSKDWIMVYYQLFDSKTDALKEEKRLKKLNRASIEKIIASFISDK
ncbi:GIY-YIG nuclease family protein [Flavobacterium sp.]|jgi:putative endonuclease|uniref:GIY-YIG nuclease family protein n=1 Tax=Flavobacterium sp. TaxID=239 RepID=UPI0037BE8F73